MPDIKWDYIKAATVPLNDPPVKTLRGASSYVLALTFTVPLRHTDEPLRHTDDPLHHTDDSKLDTITLKADLLYNRASPPPTTWSDLTGWLDKQRVLVYLCGGPGDKNPSDGILDLNKNLLRRGFVVLYLDYRGTGGSNAITAETTERWKSAEEGAKEGAKELNYFLQDSIVADLEAVRLCLGVKKWELLGQSYGGWIATTYLSFRPGGLRAVYITGGVPPVGKTAEEVYLALFRRVKLANDEYYQAHPGDEKKVKRVAKSLAEKEAPVCGRQRLTARGFLTMGRRLGGGEEGYQKMHELVEVLDKSIIDHGKITQPAIDEFWKGGGTSFKLPDRPLYAVLHEAIYCSGRDGTSPQWAAQRAGDAWVARELLDERREFSWLQENFDFSAPRDHPLYFTGEAIFRFMLEDAGLDCFFKAADALAGQRHWPKLYCCDQLKENTVPVKAVPYKDDMYVDYHFSEETLNMIDNCELIDVPDDWLHASLKKGKTNEVCNKLFGPMSRTE